MKVKEILESDFNKKYKLPLFITPVQAGFPSPADDFIENKLDLNEYLIKHPAATFFVRVEGTSMTGAGIQSSDILIVDKSLEPADKKIVIAVIDNEFTVKRFRKIKNKSYLVPENKEFQPIELSEEMNVEIWGVVTNIIHQC